MTLMDRRNHPDGGIGESYVFCLLRFRFTLLILGVHVLGLWGCGKSDPATEGQSVIHHRLREKVQTLDPAEVGDVISHAVAGDLFECLYDYD